MSLLLKLAGRKMPSDTPTPDAAQLDIQKLTYEELRIQIEKDASAQKATFCDSTTFKTDRDQDDSE
jgi:hypothetical protein